jgi:ribose transport system substrate-binding protein
VRIRVKQSLTAVAAASLALALAACGGSSSSSSSSAAASSEAPAASAASSAAPGSGTVKVDVGTSTPVELPAGKLKVGVFMNAQSNKWQQVIVAAEKKQAESYGWDLTVLDFNYDQQKMMDAMQTAVTNKTYDAWVVNPIDGNASCKMLTETAPQANILVTITGTTVCNRDLNKTADLWAPGTYSYHALAPSPDYERAWFAAVAKLNPGKQKVAIVVGPAANGASILTQNVAKEFEAANPDFHVTDYINSDYTAPTTFSATQAYLQAHTDTTLILSIYSPDISQGVVKALTSLNLVGKVKMSDMGGSQYTVDQIKAGAIQLTMPYYPGTMGTNAILAMKDAQEGKTPPLRIYDEIPGGIGSALVVTKDNIATFTPQY